MLYVMSAQTVVGINMINTYKGRLDGYQFETTVGIRTKHDLLRED